MFAESLRNDPRMWEGGGSDFECCHLYEYSGGVDVAGISVLVRFENTNNTKCARRLRRRYIMGTTLPSAATYMHALLPS